LENIKSLPTFAMQNKIIMHYLLDLFAAGTLTASFKAFFFFFFASDLSEKDQKEIDAIIDQRMKNFQNTNNPSNIRNTLRWLEHEKYSKELSNDFIGRGYITELDELKNTYLDFYKMYITEISNADSDIKQVADLIARNDQYILQISRLRMIIDPQIQLSKNIHKQTKIVYLKVKGYWLSDEGVKERKFFKSLGRYDSYPKGIKDENAIQDGRAKIREAMLVEYSSIYKK
jgi:hypothetical protein